MSKVVKRPSDLISGRPRLEIGKRDFAYYNGVLGKFFLVPRNFRKVYFLRAQGRRLNPGVIEKKPLKMLR